MTVGILALQGAFAEHEAILKKIGADTVQIRKKEDLEQHFDGLVLPGGESSVQGKLLAELDMMGILRGRIADGLPVLATCAGLILLAEEISNDSRSYFQTLPVRVKRNAYGRQLGSFFFKGKMEGLGAFPMEFIRAPYIETVWGDAQVLAEVNGHAVAVRHKNQIGVAFHPELTEDDRIHRLFLGMIADR